MDWSIGSYEEFALELEPAAAYVVELARIEPGQALLDVGCGTGNAALAAARRGARVTGVDPAQRLVSVAAERANEEGLDARFLVAGAEELPFEAGSFDAVVSVFAVIFAPDGERAVSELLRVTRPGGRIALSCWRGVSPLGRAIAVVERRLGEAGMERPRHPGAIEWNDPDAVRAALGRSGATVEILDGEQHFVGDSAEAYWDALGRRHPLGIAASSALERSGSYGVAREDAISVLAEANEVDEGFRVTSPYFVAVARMPG
jgi:SAM-dependent methyltransferase